MKKVLALIPARGQAKGMPNKNIKLFNGKFLIEWSIKYALKSKLIDKGVVSSDSPTSQLRKKNDLDNVIKFFYLNKLDSCFSGLKLTNFLIWNYDKIYKKYKSINY